MTVRLSFRKKGRTAEQRFFDFAFPEPNTGCWFWVGSLTGSGYGVHYIAPGYREQAHRYSWEIHNGKIPDGLQACHKCDVRCCVNPEHLFLGTQSENLKDMVRKGRDNPRRGSAHGKARLTELDIENIRFDTRTLRAIGEDYGVDKQYIWKIKRGVHWGHLKLPDMSHEANRVKNGKQIRARGEKHPRAVLTQEAVALIRSDSRSGPQLAELLGVTRQTIGRVRRNQNWKCVPCA
jgi:hypothetical protein